MAKIIDVLPGADGVYAHERDVWDGQHRAGARREAAMTGRERAAERLSAHIWKLMVALEMLVPGAVEHLIGLWRSDDRPAATRAA